MRETCISHPKGEPLVIVRQWQLEATGNNWCAAAILSFLEYWHNEKLKEVNQNKHIMAAASRFGEDTPLPTEPFQYQTEANLEVGLLGLYERKAIRKAIDVLVGINFITVTNNPDPRYKFDRKRYFLLNVEEIEYYLGNRKPMDKWDLVDPAPSGSTTSKKRKLDRDRENDPDRLKPSNGASGLFGQWLKPSNGASGLLSGTITEISPFPEKREKPLHRGKAAFGLRPAAHSDPAEENSKPEVTRPVKQSKKTIALKQRKTIILEVDEMEEANVNAERSILTCRLRKAIGGAGLPKNVQKGVDGLKNEQIAELIASVERKFDSSGAGKDEKARYCMGIIKRMEPEQPDELEPATTGLWNDEEMCRLQEHKLQFKVGIKNNTTFSWLRPRLEAIGFRLVQDQFWSPSDYEYAWNATGRKCYFIDQDKKVELVVKYATDDDKVLCAYTRGC